MSAWGPNLDTHAHGGQTTQQAIKIKQVRRPSKTPPTVYMQSGAIVDSCLARNMCGLCLVMLVVRLVPTF